MGYKKVCIECKLSFGRDFDFGSDLTYPCPECGKPMKLFPHRFRPPKKTNEKKWEVVELLYNNGFNYQHIYTESEKDKNNKYVEYPTNLREAKEFVEKYKSQSLKWKEIVKLKN